VVVSSGLLVIRPELLAIATEVSTFPQADFLFDLSYEAGPTLCCGITIVGNPRRAHAAVGFTRWLDD
jgi:hypothetical protein